jgi:UDP-glucose 6-dehydrogenase
LGNKPRISIIGVGYVGLCTAVGLASKGYPVVACDVDTEKIGKINQGIPPFFEPGLQEKLTESIKRGNLKGLVNQTDQAVAAFLWNNPF